MNSMVDQAGIVIGVAALVLNEGATDARARDVVRAAVEAGAVAIDTARAYARVDDHSVGERVALAGREVRPAVPIITKAGHYRVSASAWHTDGGEQRLRDDAALSSETLGAPLDLLLLHRADRVDDLGDSVRTLAALRDEGVARAIGLSNASLEALELASSLTRIDAVQNRLGLGVDAFDEYRHCRDAGITFLAYAPFGGPRAAPLATRVPRVAALATNRGVSVHRAVLAAMLDLLPGLWPVIGATRVESVRDAMAAGNDVVDDELRTAMTDDLESRGVAI